ATLEANPTMTDGEVLFDASHSNIVTGTFSATTIAQAMEKLRINQTAAGNKANLRTGHLVVEPALELPARQFIHQAGLDIGVTSNAELPTGRWYALADPSQQAALGYLRLRGAETALRIDSTARPQDCSGFAVR